MKIPKVIRPHIWFENGSWRCASAMQGIRRRYKRHGAVAFAGTTPLSAYRFWFRNRKFPVQKQIMHALGHKAGALHADYRGFL